MPIACAQIWEDRPLRFRVVDPGYGNIPRPIAYGPWWAMVNPGYGNIPVPIACAQYMGRQAVTFSCCGPGIWQ